MLLADFAASLLIYSQIWTGFLILVRSLRSDGHSNGNRWHDNFDLFLIAWCWAGSSAPLLKFLLSGYFGDHSSSQMMRNKKSKVEFKKNLQSSEFNFGICVLLFAFSALLHEQGGIWWKCSFLSTFMVHLMWEYTDFQCWGKNLHML